MENGFRQCFQFHIAHVKHRQFADARNCHFAIAINHFERIEANDQLFQVWEVLENVRIECVQVVMAQIQNSQIFQRFVIGRIVGPLKDGRMHFFVRQSIE